MARTTITATAITVTGFNLTDATFATLGVGANNGVAFVHNMANKVFLKNDTGGAASYTVKIPTSAALSAYIDCSVAGKLLVLA